MNEWIYLMVIGLGLDIAGVWMLVRPLLKIDLIKYKTVEKKTGDRLDEWLKVKDETSEQSNQAFPNWRAFTELDLVVYQWIKKELGEKITNRKKAIKALILITAGFSLQIFANILQSLE